MRPFFRSMATALFCIATTVASLEAQSIAGALARTGLVQEDINIMTRAGSTLYATGNARVGSDAIWSNPNTRAFGMVEVIAVQGACVRLAYRFQTRRRPMTQEVITRRCRVEDRWVLSE